MIEQYVFVSAGLLGVFSLLKLSWQDVFNKRMVDEREVYFVLGICSLVVFTQVGFMLITQMLVRIFAAAVLGGVFTNTLKLAGVDTKLIIAMFTLFFMDEWGVGLAFGGILLITSLVYFVYLKLTWKPLPKPYLPVILIAWVLTFAFRLYYLPMLL